MATRHPRTPIAISPEARVALQRLADASGSTLSRTAGHYLEQLAPYFHQIADLLEVAHQTPGAAGDTATALLERLRVQAAELQDRIRKGDE